MFSFNEIRSPGDNQQSLCSYDSLLSSFCHLISKVNINIILILVSSSDVDKGKDPNIKMLNDIWILLGLWKSQYIYMSLYLKLQLWDQLQPQELRLVSLILLGYQVIAASSHPKGLHPK